MVTITDPEGFPLNLVWGQQPATAGEAPAILPVNYSMDKERIRKFQRFQPGPAAVHKVSKVRQQICELANSML